MRFKSRGNSLTVAGRMTVWVLQVGYLRITSLKTTIRNPQSIDRRPAFGIDACVVW
jgi:hypothetical protein